MRPSIRPRSLPVLIKEADEVFSKFIRLRDLPGGVGKCFICGNRLTFSEAHCGHWISREMMPTRYDERNCHAICVNCNCYDIKHADKYHDMMHWKYGYETLVDLSEKSSGLQKYMRHELEELIEYYRSENRLNRTKV